MMTKEEIEMLKHIRREFAYHGSTLYDRECATFIDNLINSQPNKIYIVYNDYEIEDSNVFVIVHVVSKRELAEALVARHKSTDGNRFENLYIEEYNVDEIDQQWLSGGMNRYRVSANDGARNIHASLNNFNDYGKYYTEVEVAGQDDPYWRQYLLDVIAKDTKDAAEIASEIIRKFEDEHKQDLPN